MDASPPITAAESPPPFTHAEIKRVLWGVVVCMLLAAIDQSVVVPAMPAIAADLHGFSHLAWIVSAYLITSTSSMPIYGKLSDLYGRRALLLPAIVLFVSASALCALSQSLFQLIAFRALQGAGGGGLMSMAQATIADVVAPRERGRYQAYMATTWATASVSGPILGGWITDHLSWHFIFWINLPVGIAAFLVAGRVLKMLRVQRRRSVIDYAGAALLTALITSFLLVMSWGGTEYAWGSWPIAVLSVGTLALLAGLAWREYIALDPLLPPRLFANSVLMCGIAIAAMCSAAMLGATILLPLLFQLVRGVDASSSGAMLVPLLASGPMGSIIAGRTVRRLGRGRSVVLVGTASATLCYGLLSTQPGIVATLLLMLAVGMSTGLCMPTSMVIVQNAAGRRDVGAATGALLTLRSMGGAFGSTLAGSLLSGTFVARLSAQGVTQRIDLGALRENGSALQSLMPALRQAAAAALVDGFRVGFLACSALTMLAFVAALMMRDLPLRGATK
jgi:EmrB/QacA subfamily drug resistance transporter